MGRQKPEKRQKKYIVLAILLLYSIFVLISFIADYGHGKGIADNFRLFSVEMLVLFPPAFILVGLFEVWVGRKTVERFFGKTSGLKGHLGAILLSCTTLSPFLVVLPLAASLYKKGARLSIVLTYLGSSAICRIPMTVFEASFLGIGFSITRYAVSLPLIVVSSIIIEKAVSKNQRGRFLVKNLQGTVPFDSD